MSIEMLVGCGKTIVAREIGGKGETSETRGFDLRSSRFSELRIQNVELRVAPFPQASPQFHG
jgi:hypothetical protein